MVLRRDRRLLAGEARTRGRWPRSRPCPARRPSSRSSPRRARSSPRALPTSARPAMGRLVSLSVKEGDRVKAGQVLAQIDPVQAASSAEGAAASLRALESDASAAATQIKASQAELAAAETRAADAERALKRARELRQAGLIAQSDLDTAQAAADTAAAQVRGAEAAISRLEQTQDGGGTARRPGPRRSVAHPRSVEQDRHHRADRRHRHAPRRGAGRDGGDRRAEPARHHPDDRLGPQLDQRRGQGRRGRRAAAVDRATPPPPRSRRSPAGSFPARSSRSAPAPCRRSAPRRPRASSG